MSDPLMIDAYTTGQAYREAFEDMSAAQINALPASEYARLTGRSLTAVPAVEPGTEPAPQPPAAPEDQPQGFDVDSPEFFHAWRAERVSGGEGQGVFDSVSSGSDEYRAAAARHAGRTGYGREVHPEPLTGRYVRQDDMRDPRPLAARLSNPSNMWQGR